MSGKVSIRPLSRRLDPHELRGASSSSPTATAPSARLQKAAGVILQNYIGDTASEKYAALIAKTFEIPVMSRADGAMAILKEGEEVTLDPQRGLVYRGSGGIARLPDSLRFSYTHSLQPVPVAQRIEWKPPSFRRGQFLPGTIPGYLQSP